VTVAIAPTVRYVGRDEHGWMVRCECGEDLRVPFGAMLTRGPHELECPNGHTVTVSAR
jgi:hypothetical protein